MNDFHSPSLLQRLSRWDEHRPGVPGEHWFAFGVGVYLLQRRSSTALGGLTSLVLGVGLVARALSGRDGLIAVLRRPEPPSQEPGRIGAG